MQNIKPVYQGLFYLSRHIKSVDRRTNGRTDGQMDGQTDRQTDDRKGDYYRAPAFSMQGPNYELIFIIMNHVHCTSPQFSLLIFY